MRIDGRDGDIGWSVIDVPKAADVPACVWVDDATAQYAVVPADPKRRMRYHVVKDIGPDVIQARRIAILPSHQLVLINPVGDPDVEMLRAEVEAADRRARETLANLAAAFEQYARELFSAASAPRKAKE
jgi:hypothetical protein